MTKVLHPAFGTFLCGPHGAGRVEGNFNIFTGSTQTANAVRTDILHGSDLILQTE